MEERRSRKRRVTDRSTPGLNASEALLKQAIHDARHQAASLRALIEAMHDHGYLVTPEIFRYLSVSASELTATLEHMLDQTQRVRRMPVWSSVEDIVMSARLL